MSRQAAEHGPFDDPALTEHVADFTVARRIAVVRLATLAVVVNAHHRHAVGRALGVHRRVGIERQTLVRPEAVRPYLIAFGVIDREKVRARPDPRRAEEPARIETARIADGPHLEVEAGALPAGYQDTGVEHCCFRRLRREEIVIEARVVVLDG